MVDGTYPGLTKSEIGKEHTYPGKGRKDMQEKACIPRQSRERDIQGGTHMPAKQEESIGEGAPHMKANISRLRKDKE